jgi:hypothetical protein
MIIVLVLLLQTVVRMSFCVLECLRRFVPFRIQPSGITLCFIQLTGHLC